MCERRQLPSAPSGNELDNPERFSRSVDYGLPYEFKKDYKAGNPIDGNQIGSIMNDNSSNREFNTIRTIGKYYMDTNASFSFRIGGRFYVRYSVNGDEHVWRSAFDTTYSPPSEYALYHQRWGRHTRIDSYSTRNEYWMKKKKWENIGSYWIGFEYIPFLLYIVLVCYFEIFWRLLFTIRVTTYCKYSVGLSHSCFVFSLHRDDTADTTTGMIPRIHWILQGNPRTLIRHVTRNCNIV